ncbi:Tetratricopeptide-like helical domain superfamily [Sesbania bispinosa]|nr:Tetratricopeptide-like helical domain superfamily [Sesbania bispinosa]
MASIRRVSSSSEGFSEDLWRTVWEVSNKVLEDMNKERKKEKMKGFLQCAEVKEMCRFAGEVGIRGDLLRELRFKWAREKMEEHEFYEGLERLRKEGQIEETENEGREGEGEEIDVVEKKPKAVELPKRRGKIKYRIYGLDLSDPKWEQVADRIHEAGQVLWPQEPKPITGKCKLVTEKILLLKEEDDNLSTLLAEWVELLQPSRVDWINLLDMLKKQNPPLYFKVRRWFDIDYCIAFLVFNSTGIFKDEFSMIFVASNFLLFYVPMPFIQLRNYLFENTDDVRMAFPFSAFANCRNFHVAEMVLAEDSFQTNISDYSRLIDVHAKENHFDDTERILKKMNEKGILPDASTASALVHMYSKGGNLERAKEAFEVLSSQGFQPDIKVFTSMIMAYVNSGEPRMAENLMSKMEAIDIKPTKEIYLALLQSYSQRGDVSGAGRISTRMQFAGFQQSLETCTLLIEAHARAGEPEQARNNFDYMIKFGHKPDDRCTASMIAAYEKKNLLDKALNLLSELEKDGFEPGVATYSVFVDWLAKMQLVDEVEQLLNKIALLGEAPPFRVQVSLCDMYARAGMEKKALQTLGVLEARKDELGPDDFDRIIKGLIGGGFQQDAQRMCGIMEAQGFTASEELKSAIRSGRFLSMR